MGDVHSLPVRTRTARPAGVDGQLSGELEISAVVCAECRGGDMAADTIATALSFNRARACGTPRRRISQWYAPSVYFGACRTPALSNLPSMS
jgi:hypothetical protein